MSRAPGAASWALHCCLLSTRTRFAVSLAAPTGGRLYVVTRSKEVAEMEVEHDEQEIIQRVAALDIGKAEVVCCVRVPGPGRRRMQEIRTFNTMTRSLLAMSDWLRSLGVTRVIMEATSDSAIAVTVLPAGGLLRDLAGQRR
jgi:hypothetical protein